jgi:hypothetical protein
MRQDEHQDRCMDTGDGIKWDDGEMWRSLLSFEVKCHPENPNQLGESYTHFCK